MKYLTILFVSLLSLNSLAQSEIEFSTNDWQAILKKAKTENKLVFLDAYASWCGPCKWMSKNVFTDPQVAGYMNETFVNAKIDMEKGEGPDLAKRYGVKAYPTFLIINGDGEMVHQFCGSSPVDKFMARVKTGLDPEKRLSAVSARVEEKGASPQEMKEYLTLLDDACMDYLPAYKDFLANIPGTKFREDAYFQLAEAFPPPMGYEAFDYILGVRDALGQKFGEETVSKIIDQSIRKTLYDALRHEEEGNYEQVRNEVRGLVYETEPIILRTDLIYYERAEEWENYFNSAFTLIEKYGPVEANLLNSIAWTIYENIDNEKQLAYGVQWAEQSVNLDSRYYNHDTLAALLFKQGNNEEALAVAQTAITLAKENDEDYSDTVDLIKKHIPNYEE